MFIAYLLLALFLGGTTACLMVAMRRGLWLKVEIDQRVMHHHNIDVDAVDSEWAVRLIETRVLPRAVLPRHTTRLNHINAYTEPSITKESK